MRKLGILGLFAALSCTAAAEDLRLGLTDCGGVFGGINPKFSSDIKFDKDIDRRLKHEKWADTMFYSDAFDERTTIRRSLHESFRLLTKNKEPFANVVTPTGSEQFVANELYRLGIIRGATRPESYCAGVDESYFVVSKKSVRNSLVQSEYFSDYIRGRLTEFIIKDRDRGDLKEGRVSASPIPPKYPRKVVTLYVPGALSRGTRYGDIWDKFDVVFTLGLETKDYFVILLYVDHLESAPKVALRHTAPSDEFFKRRGGGDSNDVEEFKITGIVAKFLAGSGDRCVVNSEPVTGEPDISCTADASIISKLR